MASNTEKISIRWCYHLTFIDLVYWWLGMKVPGVIIGVQFITQPGQNKKCVVIQKEASLCVHDMLYSVGYRICYPNVIFSVAAYIDWQLIDNKGIPGHNIRDFPNIMLQACKELCMAEQPWCRSIDYYWPTGQCALSDVAFGDPGIYSWAEYPGLQYYSFCGKSYIPTAPFTNMV